MFSECAKTNDGEDAAQSSAVDGSARYKDVGGGKKSQRAHIKQGDGQSVQQDKVGNQTSRMAVDAQNVFFIWNKAESDYKQKSGKKVDCSYDEGVVVISPNEV